MINKAQILTVGIIGGSGWTFVSSDLASFDFFTYDENTGEAVMTCGWSLDELRAIAEKYGENTRHAPPLFASDRPGEIVTDRETERLRKVDAIIATFAPDEQKSVRDQLANTEKMID